VTVYEKTSEFARFGGPIQFASNALSVIKEIDDNLFDRVMEKFTFTGIRTCGIKDGMYFKIEDDIHFTKYCFTSHHRSHKYLIIRPSIRWIFSNDR